MQIDCSFIPHMTRQDIRLKLNHFSASQINSIAGCKFKWACRYIYDKKGIYKKGQNLQIGNFFHDESKYASVEGKKRFEKTGMLKRMTERVDPTASFSEKHYSRCVNVFLDNYGKLDLKNSNTEIPISGRIPDVRIGYTGFIDHLQEKHKEEKTIIDLKIKGFIEKDKLGNVKFGDNEIMQQGLYSYSMGIPRTQLHILYINKKTKEPKIEFYIAEKVFGPQDYVQILERIRMHVSEMHSGIYPPNRSYMWCKFNMCEYWSFCHDIWG